MTRSLIEPGKRRKTSSKLHALKPSAKTSASSFFFLDHFADASCAARFSRENASEALQVYFKSIGGRDKIFEQTKEALTKRKRKGASATPSETTTTKRSRKSNGHPLDATPPASAKAVEWKPPSGSWEDEVDTADMCQDEESGKFIVYLTWKNGKKTQHPKEVVYRRCPQKVILNLS